MTHAKSACFVVVAGLLALACEGQSGSGSGAPSGTGAAPAKSAAAGDGCGGGAYKDEKLKFCINVPAGFKPAAPEETVAGLKIRFEHPDTKASLIVRQDKNVTLQKAKEIMAAAAQPIGDDKTEPGSNGDTSWVITTFKVNGIQQFELYTPGAEGMLFCSFQSEPAGASPLIEACKSLHKL